MTDDLENQLSVEKHSEELGIEIPKMAPTEQAKFWLAKWVLLAGAVLMLVAWAIQFSVVMWGLPEITECRDATDATDNCRLLIDIAESRTNAANSIFEFAKTWIPPVITLVLGYYFAREHADPDGGAE